MISKSADHVCLNCGFPLKESAEDKKVDRCPWCHGTEALKIKNKVPDLKFDFTKLNQVDKAKRITSLKREWF